MKKKPLIGLAVSLVLFVPLIALAQTWISGTLVNPAAGAVIVDTGAIAGPTTIEFCAYVSANVAAQFSVQRRNAANNATLSEQRINVIASTTSSMCPKSVDIGDGERIRIVNDTLIALGTVNASLFY